VSLLTPVAVVPLLVMPVLAVVSLLTPVVMMVSLLTPVMMVVPLLVMPVLAVAALLLMPVAVPSLQVMLRQDLAVSPPRTLQLERGCAAQAQFGCANRTDHQVRLRRCDATCQGELCNSFSAAALLKLVKRNGAGKLPGRGVLAVCAAVLLWMAT